MNPAWVYQPLGELFEISAGKTMSARARTGPNQVPFLRTSNVLWDEIDTAALDHMSFTDEELADKHLEPGDLLVCEGGDVGRSAIWDGRIQRISFQNHLHRLRQVSDDVDPQFYVYYLLSAFTQLGIFEGAWNDTTIPNLSRNRLAALDVPRPGIADQRAIAMLLRTVRTAVRLQEAEAALAVTLKRATMQELFTRGLRGEEQRETEIGPIPASWDVTTLGGLGRVGNGSTPRRSNELYWSGGSFPWLTSARVYEREIRGASEFVTERALRDCHLPRVPAGSVVIAITGQGKTLGHSAVLHIEATVSQHLAYVAVDAEKATPSFVRGFLETQYNELRQVASGGGSTKGALTCAFLRDFKLPLPSLNEQEAIVEVLDALDEKIDLHKRKRAVLDQLFNALLHKLMTGEIRVADLDLSALDGAPQGASA